MRRQSVRQPGARFAAVRRRAVASGFTLIELLVVMVVIAVVISVAVLNFGDRGRSEAMATEARRLAALLEVARERAELDSVELGLDVRANGYRFLQLDEMTGRWGVAARPMFRQRELPDGLRLELKVDALALPPPSGAMSSAGADTGEQPSEDATKLPQPQVLLLSSGETSNFRVTILARDPSLPGWIVGGDGIAPVRASKLVGDHPVSERGGA